MAERDDFDVELVRENLSAARERLGRKRQTPAPDPAQDARAQGRHYRTYRDALMAAGLAAALGEAEDEIEELLSVAARAAVEVFRLRGTLTGRRTHLPEGREEVFVDESLTNPLHHAQAIYAALSAHLPEELEFLSTLRPEDYRSAQVETSPVLEDYTRILSQAVGDNPPASVRDDLKRLLSQRHDSPDDLYWLAQARVLDRLLQADAAATQTALARLKETHANYYADPAYRNRPDRFLQLPLRGLASLAQKLRLIDSGADSV